MDQELRTFKISKVNLPMIDALNKTCSTEWRSQVRDIIPFSDDHFIISVMVIDYYPFMDVELREIAEKLLDTKQGEQLCYHGECVIFDNGDWIGQEAYYDKYPDPVIDKFREKETLPT